MTMSFTFGQLSLNLALTRRGFSFQQHSDFKMAGNANSGRRQEKPFRDALRMEAILLEKGEDTPAPVGSLRWNARKLLQSGDVPAIKELADRLDGKVPQGLIGGDPDDPPIAVTRIELVALPPKE